MMKILHAQEMRFIVALANDLREKHGIFRDFDIFNTDLLPGLVRGQVAFSKVLHAYKQLTPAIHRNMFLRDVDTDAWSYALRRLPENIMSIFAVVLSKHLMDVLRSDESTESAMGNIYSKFAPGHAVATRDRRRTSWQVAPGKLFVLMRGDTDVLDFITCLCLHTVELQKLRALLKPAHRVVAVVKKAVDEKTTNKDNADAIEKQALMDLQTLTGASFESLSLLWSGQVCETLMQVLVHHGDYSVFVAPNIGTPGDCICMYGLNFESCLCEPNIYIYIRSKGTCLYIRPIGTCLYIYLCRVCIYRYSVKSFQNYRLFTSAPPSHLFPRFLFFTFCVLDDRRVSEREHWISRVRDHVVELIGDLEDPSLPPLVVDIVSSNTHSVLNILSPYLHSHRSEIMAWGKEHTPEILAAPFRFEMDRLYAIAMDYFNANPHAAAERVALERDYGIVSVVEQEFTGITVQLINLNLLRSKDKVQAMDDGLERTSINEEQLASHRHLIVNM